MRMEGFQRKEGIGIPGMYESVIEAVKKGISASGRDTLTLKVLESAGINSKRARCFGMSSDYQRTWLRERRVK